MGPVQTPFGKNLARTNAQKSMRAPTAKAMIPVFGPAACQEDGGILPSPDRAARAFPPTKYTPNTPTPINRSGNPLKRRTVTNIQVRCGTDMRCRLARGERLGVCQCMPPGTGFVEGSHADVAARGFLHLCQGHGLECGVARQQTA